MLQRKGQQKKPVKQQTAQKAKEEGRIAKCGSRGGGYGTAE
jgi:hypothetical protein